MTYRRLAIAERVHSRTDWFVLLVKKQILRKMTLKGISYVTSLKKNLQRTCMDSADSFGRWDQKNRVFLGNNNNSKILPVVMFY
jgi:hypothetical protein